MLGCIGFMIVAAGFGYWRISQGPVTIGFLSGPLENIINASLDGMRIQVRDAVIERDADDNTVQLRLREAQLEDLDGRLIARAPRAAVGLSASALFSGELRPERLELIGPRILVRRTIDGQLKLGFGNNASDEPAEGEADGQIAADVVTTEDVAQLDGGDEGTLSEMFERFIDLSGSGSAASSIISISITNAAVSIYDEVNDAIWYAPKTNLVLERVPYGMSLLAFGQVASGKQPWTIQIAAKYVAENERFSTTIKVADFVPADISDEVFVLSDLAKVNLPLTGQADFEFDRDGTVLSASAVLSAGAGHVGFPRYISQSLLVDEGEFFLTYVPETGTIAVEDSALIVGGSRATINGNLLPVRNEAGAIESLRYELLAQNVSLDTEPGADEQLSVDRFELRGLAALEEGRLDVEHLAVRAGNASLQLRGTFLEGPEVPAVFLRGAMTDIPLPILLKLWPPEAAPDAREWIVEHVSEGTVAEANLSVNLQSQALAAALDRQPIPNDQITLTFRLEGVTTHYYEDLPPLQNASGEGILRGNDFEIKMHSASVSLEGGDQLVLSEGRFFVENLMQDGTPGHISALVTGATATALRLIDQEPLHYAQAAGIDPATVGGTVSTRLDIRLPMLTSVEFEQVDIAAVAQFEGITVPEIFDDIGIQDGEVAMDINKLGLTGRGTVVLNGVSTRVRWTEDFTADPSRSQRVEATAALSDSDRERLGIDISGFVSGPLTVSVNAAENEGALERLHFKADLSKAEIFVDAIGWRRPAGQGATATFDVDLRNRDAVRVSNLVLDGPDNLAIEGGLTVDGNGEVMRVDLPVLQLGAGNRLALSGRRDDSGVMALRVEGDSFDARPLVGSVFGSEDDAGTQAQTAAVADGRPVTLEGRLRTLFLRNHEFLSNVEIALQARDGAVRELRLTGLFSDTQPIDIKVTPQADGTRAMVVESGNAGAVLRAVDLYSRVHSGTLRLEAVLGAPNTGEFRSGRLRLGAFEVIDEPALSAIAGNIQQPTPGGRASTTQSSVNVTAFDRMNMAFVIDESHFRIIDEAIVYGPTIGSSARGTIRRGDGNLNLAGTLTPAYALNAALGNLPILGQVLLGGQGQGLIGVTFAVTGTMQRPRVTVNPVSALAPGFLKRIFEFGGMQGQQPDAPAGDQSFEAQQFESDNRSSRPQRLERLER